MILTSVHRPPLGAIVLAALATLLQSAASAQDPMPGMPMPGMPAMAAGPLGISTERMGSGTTWIPDAVTLPSRHFEIGGWSAMLHGFVFGQYDWQDGPRGDTQWGSLNWAMLMASRPLAGGSFQLRTMLSLDPWTVTARGYPLLLQTGEMYRGVPLLDRQHPHDFWMELGAIYERAVSSNVALTLYVAPSGEPALGPVAFMHRPSAMDDPVAPLGHHWQDATHISFGVITAGVFTRRWKLEGSYFNGREPDDERWNFDEITLDSYSGRLTVNPDSNWSFTAGYGRLDSPEILHPGPVHRVVASALHGMRLGDEGQWASAFIYGANDPADHPRSQSVLVESELVLDSRNTFTGRWERVEKSGEELEVPGPPGTATRHFDLASFSLGYIRELVAFGGTTFGIGGRGTVNFVPRELEVPYGSSTPVGALLFIRVRPRRHSMAGTGPGMIHP